MTVKMAVVLCAVWIALDLLWAWFVGPWAEAEFRLTFRSVATIWGVYLALRLAGD